jgi:hypothetical protein
MIEHFANFCENVVYNHPDPLPHETTLQYIKRMQEHLMKRNDEHYKIQAGIVTWARYQHNGAEWLYATPNGGLRDKATGGKLKAEGVLAGVLDLFLPVLRFKFCDINPGLYLEIKLPEEQTHKDGGLSPAQVRFINFVESQGYKTKVVYATMEGIEAIREYLGM